ncbi:MAG: nucleotide sugar dehydrogenase [Anaerolineales bacterium]|nr:nucleotide sugar dehydrogenase [Anaerolineales bacterium]
MNQTLQTGVYVKFNKICVLGLGYIGLPTASTFAAYGLQVVGVDINRQVIRTLQNGGLHLYEPGLRTVVEAALKSGNLTVAPQPEPAEAFIIAVPTPFRHDQTGEYQGLPYKKADMKAVTAAAEAIVPHLQKGNLVVLESTSPPRTTIDLVAPILEKSGLKTGQDFYLCYSPERVLPGQILRELIENARVVGGITPESAQAGRDLYATFVKGEIHLTDATTAEMVKLMENTTRDINIAIANEFARLADRFGTNIWEAIRLANLHPRIDILTPGPGVGGHCISVDPWFLVESAPELTPLIQTARRVNDSQPGFVVDLVQRALGTLEGKCIAALGLSYKPDVDDLRESPAVETARLLAAAGAQVHCYEPFKPEADLPGLTLTPDLPTALEGADALLLLVNHTQFRRLDPPGIRDLSGLKVIIDTVNGLPAGDWETAGFRIFRLGDNQE